MNTPDSGVKIYDIECLANFFCYCDIDRDTKVKHTFIIHESKNQLNELLAYLSNNKILHVGYNNIGYDAQVIHYLLQNNAYYNSNIIDGSGKTTKLFDGESLARTIADVSNSVIERMNEGKKPIIYSWNYKIPQLDLYKIWHFDNKAKSTRLKDLQIAMKWPKVQDMPIHHTSDITEDQIPMILDYCDNDIMSTLEFYNKSREKIDLRRTIGEQYGIDVISANDGKIGTEIFCKIISQEKNIAPQELKALRTYRETVDIEDCILPFIKFKSWEFQYILNKFKGVILTKGEDGFIITKDVLESFNTTYKGFKYDYGLGGIHGCINPGIYVSTEDEIIKTCDVTSLYPRIGITRKFYPEHLGEGFVPIYDGIYTKRDKAKKLSKADKTDKTSKAINEGLKYSLNIPYGKSNEGNSFFYDPKYTMQITINGQLMISMLAERLQDAGFKMLMANTDGLECIVSKNKLELYDSICKDWEKETLLDLEIATYDKMIIRDVNNYIAISDKGEVKYKGCFEIIKDLHKDPSFPIVAIALSEYYIKGIPFETTIKTFPYTYTVYENGKINEKTTDILDFAGRGKFKSESHGEIWTIDYSGGDYKTVVHHQQKTTRYLVTTTGGVFVKIYNDGEKSYINKGYRCTEFNNLEYKPIEKYNLDYKFYINECRKIQDVISPLITQQNIGLIVENAKPIEKLKKKKKVKKIEIEKNNQTTLF